MTRHCSYGLCSNDDRKPECAHLKWCKFPKPYGRNKDVQRAKRWLYLCGTDSSFCLRTIKSWTMICSEHFPPEFKDNLSLENKELEPFPCRSMGNRHLRGGKRKAETQNTPLPIVPSLWTDSSASTDNPIAPKTTSPAKTGTAMSQPTIRLVDGDRHVENLLLRLWLDEPSKDLTIAASGKMFRAHRSVLACASNFLGTVLLSTGVNMLAMIAI